MGRISYLIGIAALLSACSAEPTTPAEPETRSGTSVAEILAAPTLQGAHPAIRNFIDQGNPTKQLSAGPNNGVRNIAIDIECPSNHLVTCGAEATRAAAIWLAKHGSEWGDYKGETVTDLLITVNPLGKYGGYGLGGAMPATSVLERADTATILTIFRWKGAGENGEIAVAEWCGKANQKSQTPEFCAAFFEDECSPIKADPVVKACPRELLQR